MKRTILVLALVGPGLGVVTAWGEQRVDPLQLAQQSVTGGGHTADMPTREGHKTEHEKDQTAPGSTSEPATQTGHDASMPGRESHSKQHEEQNAGKNEPAAGAPVTSGEHTVDMPNREGHKKEHENK